MDESRLELKIGSPVIAKDGNCGHIQQLIIDPDQEKVIGLIVKRDLLLPAAPRRLKRSPLQAQVKRVC